MAHLLRQELAEEANVRYVGRPAAKAIRVGGKKRREDVLGEVVEREGGSTMEIFRRRETGFPVATHRPTEGDVAADGSCGERVLSRMSRSEIREALAEIRSKLKPETIAFLKRRGQNRGERPPPSLPLGVAVRVRFDLDGRLVDCLTEEAAKRRPIPSVSALQRDPLRQEEGSVAEAGVYTLNEAAALVQSAVQGQRMAGLQVLSGICRRARPQGEKDPGPLSEGISWREIWTALLGEVGLMSTIRLAMRDRSEAVAKRGLALALELCRLSAVEERTMEVLWSQPRGVQAARACTVPLQRATSSRPWERATPEQPSLRARLEEAVEEGFLSELRTFVRGETLPAALELLTALCHRAPETSERIAHAIRLLEDVGAAVGGDERQEVRERFLEFVCAWVLYYPAGLTALDANGWMELVVRDVGRWMKEPPKGIRGKQQGHVVEADQIEVRVLRRFFKFWRLAILEGAAPLSMEDLFPVYFPLVETATPGHSDVIDAVQQIFLCCATAAESSSPTCQLSTDCTAALRKAALKWLPPVLSAAAGDRSSGKNPTNDCAVPFFLLSSHGLDDMTETSTTSGLSRAGGRSQLLLQKGEMLEAVINDICLFASIARLCRKHKTSDPKLYAFCVELVHERTKHLADVNLETPFWELRQMVEVPEVLRMQQLHFVAEYYAELLQSSAEIPSDGLVGEETSEEFPTEYHFHLGWKLMTCLPAGSASTALSVLDAVLTFDMAEGVLQTVQQTLPMSDREQYLSREVLLQDCRRLRRLLQESFAATWCDVVPEELYRNCNLPPIQESPAPAPSHTEAVGSRFPLPQSYLLHPWRRTPPAISSSEERELTKAQLMLLIFLEKRQSGGVLSALSPDQKLQQLMQITLLATDPDLWQEPLVLHCLLALTGPYVEAATQAPCAFQTWSPEFVSELLERYCASGDVVFGRFVALLFLNAIPAGLKVQVWRTLEANCLLHCLPDQSTWYGDATAYDAPSCHGELISCIETAFESGALKKAEKCKAGLFQWAQRIVRKQGMTSNQTTRCSIRTSSL